MRRISLNLATHPLRNNRLYIFLAGLLGLGLLFSVALGGSVFIRYKLKKSEVESNLGKIESSILEFQREEKSLSARNREAEKRDGENVNLVNGIILKKSFSWTEFLTQLETCLPDSSYILSLAPTSVEDTKVQFRFKVVSQGLDDLLKLVNNLQSLNFSQIRVENEEKNPSGQLVSDIIVNYERTL